MFVVVPPTADTYGGNDPSAKQVEPTMNSAPIHHAAFRGAHHAIGSRTPRVCLYAVYKPHIETALRVHSQVLAVFAAPPAGSITRCECGGLVGEEDSVLHITTVGDRP